MGKTLAGGLIATAWLACVAPVFAGPSIVPEPARITEHSGRFTLSAATILVATTQTERAAAEYLQAQLRHTGGPDLHISESPSGQPAIVLRQTKAALPPEGYRLTITKQGVTIEAASAAGLFYGAVTLAQMAENGPALPAVEIDDQPRYGWRGLMVDSARHFQTPAELKRLIDVMAAHKLNVLHWHLVDDQGWRLEIKKYPRLTEVSSRRQPAGAQGVDAQGRPVSYGGFYTQAEVRDLVAYAAARHITIVPEIEMPGHALSAIEAYPQFGVTGERPNEKGHDWGVYPYLYNIDDATFGFLTDVLDQVMGLFPSPYIHIGGDEAIKNQWQASPAIQARMKALGLKDEHALQSWFIRRIGEHLTQRGRKLLGWDEILEGGLAPDATVMSWQGLDGAKAAARMGHDTVLSPWPQLYLDSRQSLSKDEPPGRGALSTLRMVYDFDSTPDDLTPAEHRHIIGLQANAWTEHMRTAHRLETAAFPRLIAVAEVAWTPEPRRDWSRFAKTLPATVKRLETLGVTYDPVPFEPDLSLKAAGDQAEVTLASPLGFEVRYGAEGSLPTLSAAKPFTVALPTRLTAQSYLDSRPIGRQRTYDITREAVHRRASDQLLPCTPDTFPHRLEDDAPTEGPRAVFAINVYKSCWVWPAVDLGRAYDVTARIGQAPFNFQLAGGRREVVVGTPETPLGELVIRRREGANAVCEGPALAVLPLTPANTETPTVSTLRGRLPATAGTGDLCLSFNRPGRDPVWAIDTITLLPVEP